MQIAYWIVGGLLALFNLYAGGIKLIRSRQQLRPMMQWVDAMPMWQVRTIGALEVLAAIGLILPPLTGVLPWLALAAAIGLVALQLAAAALHRSRHEPVVMNAVLVLAAAVVAWLSTAFIR